MWYSYVMYVEVIYCSMLLNIVRYITILPNIIEYCMILVNFGGYFLIVLDTDLKVQISIRCFYMLTKVLDSWRYGWYYLIILPLINILEYSPQYNWCQYGYCLHYSNNSAISSHIMMQLVLSLNRWLMILLRTFRYWDIHSSSDQYYLKSPNIVQYCSIVFKWLFQLILVIAMNIQILPSIVRNWQILTNIA